MYIYYIYIDKPYFQNCIVLYFLLNKNYIFKIEYFKFKATKII